MRLRGKKPIVYLDHNWMSEITKAHIDGWTGKDKPYFEKLSSAIQAGVNKDRFACPTSSFHTSEASFSSEVKDSLRSVAEELGHGLAFTPHIDISHRQLAEAALEFSERDSLCTPWWRIPFNRDPDAPASNFPSPGASVYLTMDMWAEEEKRLRDVIQAPMYQTYKEMRCGYGLSYEDEGKFSERRLFIEGYLGPMMALGLPDVVTPGLESLSLQSALDFIDRFGELMRICGHPEKLDMSIESSQFSNVAFLSTQANLMAASIDHCPERIPFLLSPQFSNTPFLSIRSKLMAADIARYPCRKPEPSLQDDFSIVATVLPYSDAFATDNYIAELIKQTHVGSDHDCRVFTMRQKEDLLEYLSTL